MQWCAAEKNLKAIVMIEANTEVVNSQSKIYEIDKVKYLKSRNQFKPCESSYYKYEIDKVRLILSIKA
jgi:hypothetical protein